MDRVRAGLAGLGLVFLFTLLASVAFAPSRALEPAKAPGEPLAQLGVAPSNDKATDSQSNAPAIQPQTQTQTQPQVAERPTSAVPDAALSTLERGETPQPL